MKVALLVVHDYTGGTALWAQNFVAGMEENGQDVFVLKSTRQKMIFTSGDGARDVKVRNETEIARELKKIQPDLVVLQSGYDAPKQITKHPLWMRAMRELEYPFTFAIHDDAASYDLPVSQAYLKQMFAHPKFVKSVLSFSVLPNDMLPKDVTQIQSVLPFVADGRSDYSDTRVPEQITLFSYVGKVKQWAMVYRAGVLADKIHFRHPVTRHPLIFTLCGGAATSPGVSPTTRAWTLLRDAYNAEPIDLDVSDPESDVHKPLPWSMKLPNGTELGYQGKFDQSNVNLLMSECGMTLNTTTRRGGSLGPAEYVTLEAIRAGTRTVLPAANAHGHRHLDLTTYRVFQEKHLNAPAIIRGDHDATILDMLEAIEHEFEQPDSLIPHRVKMLHEHHDPQRVAWSIFNRLAVSL